ncbi:MAG: EVE domain-containing protein [Verrucomicrobiales bacterium]
MPNGKENRYWLVKQEPEEYSFSAFHKDKTTLWTGVRNHQARNNLADMKKGDLVLYYHSGKEKAVVGEATVSVEAKPDPTADDEHWVSPTLKAGGALKKPVTLARIKQDSQLENISLIRQSRLSVMPLTKKEYQRILSLSQD